jgi:DNA-binding winged helix-turn-helix (wHTH) protein/tetratricopeptide (TPR) repeat protein
VASCVGQGSNVFKGAHNSFQAFSRAAMTQQTKHLYEFGPFRIDPAKRLLQRGEESIQLPSKVFETLLVLIQNGGEVVSKDALMRTVWPDSFVEESNLSQSIFLLRKALGETAQDHRYIVTMPGRGYRFVESVKETCANDLVMESHFIERVTVEEVEFQRGSAAGISFSAKIRQRPWNWILSATAVVALLALTALLAPRMRRPAPLNEADLVLVSDFVNTTGEPAFDGSLKQALTVKLAESPYFNIVLDSTTRQTLGLMGRSSDERVVPPFARDVCQREGAKVVVGGSILNLGNKYVVGLDAVNCLTGANLAHQQIEALSQQQVLKKLGEAIPPLRRKLGESVSSIQKFNTPIEQATTKSLAALKAYTAGDEKRAKGREAESVPFYELAIELDPDFALAYARLAAVYKNLNQADLAAEYLRKAFERREHVSEREKFYIQAHYYHDAIGDNNKSIEAYKLWTDVYTHDVVPFNSLSSEYIEVGQPSDAIVAGQQALRVNPNYALAYASLSRAYERATRFAEAKAICERANEKGVDSFWTHELLYRIAFVESDGPAMRREMDWFKGKPQESVALYFQAKAALSLGQLRRSRGLFESARAVALRQGLKEQAAVFANDQALYEADIGSVREIRELVDQVLRLMPSSARHKAFATLALARSGDTVRANILVQELDEQTLSGVVLNDEVLPSVRAALDLDRRNPAAAIEELRTALPYDLGNEGGMIMYYRGLAYLELKSPKEAMAQFHKILDNRGVVTADIYWPLAHLGLARAYGQAGDTRNSLTWYREFLELWKDADPNLRMLNEATTEYKKLSEDQATSP